MVRLKEERDRLNPNQEYEFQFHNGSIKSRRRQRGGDFKFTFQFHNGSIKSQAEVDAYDTEIKVSIPQWFD